MILPNVQAIDGNFRSAIVAPMRPLITLTTDFGLTDAYVAQMKAAIFAHCPEANVIDVTHLIPPQDVLAGSIALERAIHSFPSGTVHVGVVDPGVGTERKILAVQINEQTVLVPDNGMITWAYRRMASAGTASHELLWRPDSEISNTFHGRDIFAPAAGMIASGTMDTNVFVPVDRMMLLDIAPAKTLKEARIIAIDHFGNAITNVPSDLVSEGMRIHKRFTIQRTYSDARRGQPVVLVGSSGLIEIAINGGNVAKKLKLRVGQQISMK